MYTGRSGRSRLPGYAVGVPHAVVVHYHEIGLKGRNRSYFERALVRNLEDAMHDLEHGSVRLLRGRVIVATAAEPDAALLDAVGRTFGVATYAPATQTSATLDDMSRTAVALFGSAPQGSFAVSARRATKDLPFTSHDVNVHVGAAVQAATDAPVNLNAPDTTVHIEIVEDRAFVYVDKRRGPGGLPTGVSGRVVSMLSGGIDSPVATYRLMRRGSRVSLCHFHSEPFTDRAGVRKAKEIAGLLASFHGDTTLYLVPFGRTQQEIVGAAPASLRVVLYRRFMVRIAAELAVQEGATALVTGESLGQVASQTLENIVAIDAACPIPILRPLIGDDKQDIVAEARRIGTYETSILPYEDCCSLFVPRSPATRTTSAECEEAEAALDVAHLVERAVKETEAERVLRPERGGVRA